jgi:riboflavin kinase/FMN adenylyltransferase
MKVLNQKDKLNCGAVAAIGVFDGVHIGHRFLLEKLKKTAIESSLKSLAVTFNNHPKHFFSLKSGLKLITTNLEKFDLIEKISLDYILALDFDEKISAMKSADFLLFLKENYSVKKLIVGYDHRFGADKISDFEQYKTIGQKIGIEIEHCEPYFLDLNADSKFAPKLYDNSHKIKSALRVSSSKISAQIRRLCSKNYAKKQCF